ncbi:MAG: molybdenum ABC transporter ATP-binding protein [Sulfitobacter sp.]
MSLELSLRHSFGAFELDLAFEAGAGITALFGRSGAGKSTVIKAVAGLLRPDAGWVRFDGEMLLDRARGVDRPAAQRRFGVVFQEARLFPHLDVRGNLMFGARYAPRGAAGPGLAEVCDLLGLEALLGRAPGGLSGGEKQRVAIGRALLSRPRMLLMDEPLASLDAPRKQEILPYLERLRDGRVPIPVLYVSHALDEVARLADTMVLMQDGKLAAAGPMAQVMADPAHVPLIGAREAGAVVQARIESHGADGLTTLALSQAKLHVPRIDGAVGQSLRLRVMAHEVIIATQAPEGISALNILPVTVEALRQGQGPGAMVVLRSGSDQLLARVTARAVQMLDLRPGMACFAIVKATSVAPGQIGAGH